MSKDYGLINSLQGFANKHAMNNFHTNHSGLLSLLKSKNTGDLSDKDLDGIVKRALRKRLRFQARKRGLRQS